MKLLRLAGLSPIAAAATLLLLLLLDNAAMTCASDAGTIVEQHAAGLSNSDSSALLRGGGGSAEGNGGNDDYKAADEASSSSSNYPHVKVRQLGAESAPPGQSVASIVQSLMGVLDKTKATTETDAECSSDEPCGMCEGDCNGDRDCAGILRCFQRYAPFTAVPGCLGAEGKDDTNDFCYMPADDAGPELRTTDCRARGAGSCGLCEGDCRRDADCAGGLRCFHRNYELTAVPGCYGGEFDNTRNDFCYDPPPAAKNEIALTSRGCSPDRPCAKCRGECFADDDCQGNLKCMERPFRFQAVPGCLNGENFEDPVRFCYDLIDDNQVKDDLCTSDTPCGWCTGDCDTDEDCAFGLVCFQRELGYTAVPGCKKGEDVKFTTDYCVNPVDVGAVEPVLTARTHDSTGSVTFSTFCSTGPSTCLLCMGNCNRNEDCFGNLICWQRNQGDLAPGCFLDGNQARSDLNVCIDPAALATPDAPEVAEVAEAPEVAEVTQVPESTPAIVWPDDFYNYDLADTTYGPLGWERVNIRNNEWQRFDSPSTSANACNGVVQSPIDLTYANAPCEETHHIYYYGNEMQEYVARRAVEFAITPFRLRINFREIDGVEPPGIDPPGGIAGGITLKDVSHAEVMVPSEHAIGGRKFDAEYRIYHAQDSYDTVIAVALMISIEQDAHNPYWERLLRNWEKVEDCGNGNGYRPEAMEDREIYAVVHSMYFWAYEGSLTAPPCSQIVQWRVIDSPIQISKAQLQRTEELLKNGGPCGDHPARRTLGQNGGARPLQRDSSNSLVWRCTVDDYQFDRK